MVADLTELLQLYELGKLRAAIESRFSMNQAVDARRRIEEGVDRAKVMPVNRS